LKNFLKTRLRGGLGSALYAMLLRLVFLTSRKHYEPGSARNAQCIRRPVIYVSWHGHSYLFPFLFRSSPPPTLLVARHGDGRTVGDAMNRLGLPLAFGSGSTDKTDSRKGGAVAFLRMLKILNSGGSVKMTADVPKVARVAGEGAVLLARKSGCPIVPVAIASSRRRFANSWDQMQINLPFSKIAFVLGEPIDVPDDGSDLSVHQHKIQTALDTADARALELAGGRIFRTEA